MAEVVQGQTQKGSPWERQCKRREFMQWAATLALTALAACAPPTPAVVAPPTPFPTQPTEPSPTPTLKPTIAPSTTPTTEPTSVPTEVPTEVPPTPIEAVPLPVPTVEGPTIQGETLAIGGTNLELRKVSGEQIAEIVGAREKNWLIVTNENGNSGFFVGYAGPKGREVQVAVLAQGPQGYQWDDNTMTWQQNGHVVVPDILLPGGWNEEKNMAGPAHEAETVFLFKDDGTYRVGVLYSPGVVAQITDKSNLEILPDGRGLYVGVQKNFDLQIGQTIVRDNDNNLRLVDPGGNYLLMRTSWENVTSPDQLYQAGAFAGPIEVIPELPYPPPSLVGENYGGVEQLEDGTVVAKDGKNDKLVIAKATYNPQKGQWEWLKTIPLENLVVPDPRTTNPELFDLNNPSISQFVLTMKNAGIEVDPQKIIENLEYQVITGADGKEYVLATYKITDENGTPYTMGLFGMEKKEGGWKWEELLPKHSQKINGIPIGTLVGGYGDPENYQNIINTQIKYFSGGAVNLGWGLVEPEQNKTNYGPSDSDVRNIILKMESPSFSIGYHVVAPTDIPRWALANDDFELLVKNRITLILNRYPDIKMFSLVSEAFHPNGDFFAIRLGEDYYLKIFELVKQIRPDAFLIYNDFDNHLNNWPRTQLTRQIINQLGNKGLVNAVGVQFNFHITDEFNVEDVKNTLKSYGIPVIITEANVKLGRIVNKPLENRLKLQAQRYYQMFTACRDSGVCIGFVTLQIGDRYSVFEQLYLPEFYHPDNDPTLFDDNLIPKPAYYSLLSAITFH